MILLDTHVLVWWVEGGGNLSTPVMAALDEEAPALVSPISFWEVAMLVERRRVTVDRELTRWARDLVSSGSVQVADLTVSAAVAAAQLTSFPGDPADRFIYATARELGVSLASKDRRIRDHARHHRDVKVIW